MKNFLTYVCLGLSSFLSGIEQDLGMQQKDLAIEYYKEQNLEASIHAFLKALDNAKILNAHNMSKDEDNLYRHALNIYLNPRNSPQESGTLIKNQFTSEMHEHSSYYNLGYLVAIAYLNLLQFDRFYNLFYSSYQRLPEHFLAFKAKAILYMKLYEKENNPQEKEELREQIVKNVIMAKNIYPKDLSLYKLEIVFSRNSEKDAMVVKNVKELMNSKIIIPRTELPFYIDELLAHGHNDLAQELIKKAREWYPFSQTLDTAEEFIKQKKPLKE